MRTGAEPLDAAAVTDPLDGVQLGINYACAIALLMESFTLKPGWEHTSPSELYDQARALLGCRIEYREGLRWRGDDDR